MVLGVTGSLSYPEALLSSPCIPHTFQAPHEGVQAGSLLALWLLSVGTGRERGGLLNGHCSPGVSCSTFCACLSLWLVVMEWHFTIVAMAMEITKFSV